jgi:hypothetical protein
MNLMTGLIHLTPDRFSCAAFPRDPENLMRITGYATNTMRAAMGHGIQFRHYRIAYTI